MNVDPKISDLAFKYFQTFLFLGLFAQHQKSPPDPEEVDGQPGLGSRLEVPEEHAASHDAACRGQSVNDFHKFCSLI